jgi:hypothetical protein
MTNDDVMEVEENSVEKLEEEIRVVAEENSVENSFLQPEEISQKSQLDIPVRKLPPAPPPRGRNLPPPPALHST